MTAAAPAGHRALGVIDSLLSRDRAVSRLALGTLVLNLLVGALVGLSIYLSYQKHIRYAEITTQNLARLLDESIGSYFARVDVALLEFEDERNRMEAAGQSDDQAIPAFLAQQLEHNANLFSMHVADARGVVRYSAGTSPVVAMDVADREYFIRARDDPTAGLIVTRPLLSRLSGKWALVLARRMSRPDGSFAGVVFADLELGHFTKLFADVRSGARSSLTLRDQDMKLIVRYPEPKDLASAIGSQPSPEMQALIRSGRETATYRARNPLDHIDRTLSYRKVTGQPLYIAAGQAVDDYLVEWRIESAVMAGLAGMFLLVTLILTWLTVRFWRRQRAAADAVREQRDFLDTILDSEPGSVTVVAADGELLQINRGGLALFEVDSLRDAKEAGFLGFVHPDFRDAFVALRQQVLAGKPGSLECQIEGRRGTRRWIDLHASPLHDASGAVVAQVGVARDITERKHAEAIIRHMAEHDPLTDLPNRILFESHVRVTLAVAQREHGRFALLLVDLDRFKAVNDSMGHRVGDLLLQEVARRLLQAVRESDTPARIGGDEFVVLLRTIRRPDDAMTVAEKVRTLLAEPFIIEGSAVAISASIGIALYPEHGVNAVELLRNADAAMYRAKEHGRNAVAFSTPVE